MLSTKRHRYPVVSILIALLIAACLAASPIQNKALYTEAGLLIADKSEVSINRQTGLRMYQDKVFTGEARQYHSNGFIATAEQFLNGKRHGFWRTWASSGLQSLDAAYQNNRLEGTKRTWWDNGQLRSKNEYVDGVMQGLSSMWYRSGALFKRMNYVDGIEYGLQQAWRENGKLYANYEARNGRIFGLKKANLCYGLEDEIVTLSN